MARRPIVPVPVPERGPERGPGTSATDQPGPATATFVDLPMPIIRPYVWTCTQRVDSRQPVHRREDRREVNRARKLSAET